MSESWQWDRNRAQEWDLGDGSEDDLSVLLGALGAMGKPLGEAQAALRRWLESPASKPAPGKLLGAVRKFLEVPVD